MNLVFPLYLTAVPADNFITIANTSVHSAVWSCIQASQAVVISWLSAVVQPGL